jgi:hypothetical protein
VFRRGLCLVISRVPLCLLVIAIYIQPPSWLVDLSSPICLALGFDFGTTAQFFERNLRLPLNPPLVAVLVLHRVAPILLPLTTIQLSAYVQLQLPLLLYHAELLLKLLFEQQHQVEFLPNWSIHQTLTCHPAQAKISFHQWLLQVCL